MSTEDFIQLCTCLLLPIEPWTLKTRRNESKQENISLQITYPESLVGGRNLCKSGKSLTFGLPIVVEEKEF